MDEQPQSMFDEICMCTPKDTIAVDEAPKIGIIQHLVVPEAQC